MNEAGARADAASHRFGRALAALPDALTALAYAWAWLQPLRFGDDVVKTLMLVMLMEFLVVHSGGFLGVTVLSDGYTRMQKSLAILGFGCFYLLFAVAFSLAFHAWWPVLTFVWLLGSRFAVVWLSPLPRQEEVGRQMSLWALSVAAYLAAVFLGVLLPLPALGVDDALPRLALKGGGLWVEKPWTVLASGLFYFSVMAWSKWKFGPAR